MSRHSKPGGRVQPARQPAKRAQRTAAATRKFDDAIERLCLSARDAELANVIDDHIQRVLWAAHGEISLAAQLLGLHRRSLQRMIQRRAKKAKKPKMKARVKTPKRR